MSAPAILENQLPPITETREVPQIAEPEQARELSTAYSVPAPTPEPTTEHRQITDAVPGNTSETITRTENKPTREEIEALSAGHMVLVPADKMKNESAPIHSSTTATQEHDGEHIVNHVAEAPSTTSSTKPTVVVKEKNVTVLPDATEHITTTTTKKRSESDTIKYKLVAKMVGIWCPKEAVPVVMHLRQLKKSGVEIQLMAELMLKAAGA